MALIGLAILCGGSGCSEQPVEKPKSRFTQEGLDAIATGCGLKAGSIMLEGASSVRLGSGLARDYKQLNCVQTKIREVYYPGATTAFTGNATDVSEGDNAQTH